MARLLVLLGFCMALMSGLAHQERESADVSRISDDSKLLED